ncbi:MAG TPA: hypothetical protein VMX94_10085 [Armatimonadota bacterium]|nr:hypothetical protein [Armatimonadota bacterium]
MRIQSGSSRKAIPKIATLNVSKFRGIVDSTLRLDGKSAVIHGESGSGKSSFVAALSFFYKSTLPGFVGIQELSLAKHAHHVSASQSDVRIEVLFEGCPDPFCRTFDAEPQPSDGLSGHFELGRQCHFILRRADLLDFIEARPADRFDAIAILIGIEGLSPIDLLWQKAAKDSLQGATGAAQMARLKQQELADLIPNAPDDQSRLRGIGDRLEDFGVQRPKDWSSLPGLRAKVAQQATPPDTANRTAELAKLARLCGEILQLRQSVASSIDLEEKLRRVRAELATETQLTLLDLLQLAERLVKERPADDCPLCGSVVGVEELLSRIHKKKQALLVASELADDLRGSKAKALAKLQNIKERMSEVQRIASQAVGIQDEVLHSSLKSAELAENQLSPTANLLSVQAATSFSQTLNSGGFEKCFRNLETTADKAQNDCRLSERGQQAADLISFIDNVLAARERLREATSQQQKAEEIAAKVKVIADTFTQVKREEVQYIFDQLESRIATYYTFVHKGEPTSGHRLELDEARRASLYIRSQFHDVRDVDPRAYHSEGHLDSLGLAIFLAFAQQFNAGFPLLILDDVVATTDAQHMERTCQLLLEHFSDKQLIITSHDRWWTERLREWINRKGKSQQFKFIELYDWSVQFGPKMNEYLPRLDRVFQLLDNNQKEEAAGLSRHCLEWLLNELTIALEIPVARSRFPSYDLSTLMSPFFSTVKKHLKGVVASNADLFSDFESIASAANPLTHYNEWAQNAPKALVRELAENIKALQDLLYCDKCGEFLTYNKLTSKVSCRKGCKTWDYK